MRRPVLVVTFTRIKMAPLSVESAIVCGLIFAGVMIPRRRLWCLKLWICVYRHWVNIEALLLEINYQENKPKYNIMLKDDKVLSFTSKSPMSVIQRLLPSGQRTVVSTLVPIRCGSGQRNQATTGSVSLFENVPARPLRSVFTTISANVWPILSVKDEVFRVHGSGGF